MQVQNFTQTTAESEYDCPNCEDTGWVRREVDIDHPDFGKAFRCPCRQEADRHRLAQRAREMCQLPRELRGDSFDSYQPSWNGKDGKAAPARGLVQARQRALDAAKSWVKEGGWLLLQGPYSVGKTHLAAAAVNDLVDRLELAVFGCVPDILDALRAQLGKDDFLPLLDGLRDCPWLVLDDLGMENETEWVKEKLTQVFNYRADHGLPLFVTSNNRVESFPPRIAARIRRLAVKVVLA